MVDSVLLDSLHCPKCQGELTSKSAHLNCSNCKIKFERLNGIDWLFAHPEASWVDWRERVQYQLQLMAADLGRIQSALSVSTSPNGQLRLSKLADGIQNNFNVIGEILKPMAVPRSKPIEIFEAAKSELPLQHKLMGYEANIHRDWCWGEDELRQQLDLLEKIKPADHRWGRVLILGAGTGRLGFDLSHFDGVDAVINLDINPLLLSFGKAVSEGRKIEFFEVPLAPKSKDHAAVREICQAPGKAPEHLHWILADGMNPPFKANTFETVVTPWFIDVVPQKLASLAARINRILKPGGRWLNFGPYGFINAPISGQYSLEEVFELVAQSGFKLDTQSVNDIPYLQSPHSGQKRVESVLTFWGKKVSEATPESPFKNYPEWLTDIDRAIPNEDRLSHYQFATQLQSEVLAQIDGKTSLRHLGQSLSKSRGLSAEDGLGAVVMLLRRLWDGA